MKSLKVLALTVALALPGVAAAQESYETMLWTLELHRDDRLRITSTAPPLDSAISLAVGRRGDTLFVRALKYSDNTFGGAVPFSSIRTLEVERHELYNPWATVGPILTGIAGGAIGGGVTYALTCGREGCYDMEGLATGIMTIVGMSAGAGIGNWYFTRGRIKWVPVLLPIRH
jgi:hypothetical protein